MASISDDFSDTTATTGLLPIGGAATGVIERFGDRDWFKVKLEALVTYKFALKGNAASNWANTWLPADLRFVEPTYSNDPNVFSLTLNAYGAEPAISVKVEHAGEYFLEVSSWDHPGAYTLTSSIVSRDDFSNVASKNSPVLAVGGQRTGVIDDANDYDTFQVQLEGGKTYTFTAQGVADSTGHTASPTVGSSNYTGGLQFNVNGGYPANAYAPVSGTYYVNVSDTQHGTGGYVLKANLASDDFIGGVGTTSTLAVDASVSGQIELPTDQDWFKIKLTENVTYNFVLRAPNSSTYLRLLDHDGNFTGTYGVELPNGGHLISWTPTQSGSYFLAATGGNSASAYTLSASLAAKDDYLDNAGTTGVLASNASIGGHLETLGDKDWVQVDLQGGTTYIFKLSGALGIDGVQTPLNNFKLVDASGTVFQESPSYWNTSPAIIVFQPKTSGSYYLDVEAPFNVAMASYSITSETTSADQIRADISTSASIAPGDVLRGAIDFATDKDWYRVDLQAGETYSFVVTGKQHEGGTLAIPNLNLYDANGHTAWGYNFIYNEVGFTFRPQTSGSYFVEVAAQWDGAGTYTLSAGDSVTPLKDIVGPHGGQLEVPLNLANSGPGSYLAVHFDEPIVAGSGLVKLSLANGTVIETFDIQTSSAIDLQSQPFAIRIDPVSAWLPAADYKLEFPAGVLTDTHGNPLAASYISTFRTVDAPQNLTGTSSNDVFQAGTGPDHFDGGAGLDTVTYSLPYNFYNFKRAAPFTVSDRYNGFNVDSLTSIERVQFSNLGFAFDTDGAAGQVYRMYQAAFNRVPDNAGLGFWLKHVDAGLSLNELAKQFIASDEFKTLYGATPTNEAYITKMYENVLHRAPEQSGFDYWMHSMQTGTSQAQVLESFSESPENVLGVHDAIQYGIVFTPFL
jgi:hypothetical protein